MGAGCRVLARCRVAAPVGNRIRVFKSIGIAISIGSIAIGISIPDPVSDAISDASSLAATDY